MSESGKDQNKEKQNKREFSHVSDRLSFEESDVVFYNSGPITEEEKKEADLLSEEIHKQSEELIKKYGFPPKSEFKD